MPHKFMVWEDETQQVHIAYNDPLYLARRHGIEGFELLFETIADVLGEVARQGWNS